MYKNYIILLILFFFSACSTTPKPGDLQGYDKVFEAEDRFIVMALRAEQVKNYKVASELFDILYEKSAKKEYLYRSLQNDLDANEYEKILKRVQEEPNDVILSRTKVIALVKLNRLDEAEKQALELVDISKQVDDYILVGDIYVLEKKFTTAVKYLESAYTKDYNEKILDKISIILYLNLDRKKEAIAQLETHSRIHSCSETICGRLISFYSNENDIDGLLSAYLRYYKLNPLDDISNKIVQIYGYKKEYIKLIDFLQETKSNDEALLELYVKIKNYDKAYVLAYKLYEQSGDVEYLGQSAIYEYESKKNDLKSSVISNIMKKFEKVVAQRENALYLNYYGYLLIDHGLDVKKGIKYVQKALKLYPDSSYYMDSLAWGYYKLSKCKKAKSIMDKVIKLEGGDQEEILFHIKKIDKCIKNKKGN